jgi:hypothetical protein
LRLIIVTFDVAEHSQAAVLCMIERDAKAKASL